MKKIFLWLFISVLCVVAVFFVSYWTATQPIGSSAIHADTHSLDPLNKRILEYVEAEGERLAPNYKDVVCTEFVIKVVQRFVRLNSSDRKAIRIVDHGDLRTEIRDEAPTIRGVQTALLRAGKGKLISDAKVVQPGDFVQFWNEFNNQAYGHCGIVLNVEPNESLTVYSSHPSTDGFGKQKFLRPDKVYFCQVNKRRGFPFN